MISHQGKQQKQWENELFHGGGKPTAQNRGAPLSRHIRQAVDGLATAVVWLPPVYHEEGLLADDVVGLGRVEFKDFAIY